LHVFNVLIWEFLKCLKIDFRAYNFHLVNINKSIQHSGKIIIIQIPDKRANMHSFDMYGRIST